MILLLVLFLSDKNAPVRDTLNSFLQFYRENRDLIAMFTQTPAKTSPTEEPCDERKEEPKKDEEKACPKEQAGSVDILEAFLKRNAV